MSSLKPAQAPRRSLAEKARTAIAHKVFLFYRAMTLGVRAVVFDAEGRVLLVRHGYVVGWHFPGGGVDPGETCQEALKRELSEEACIAVDGPVALHGLFFNRRLSRRDHVAVYVVRNFRVEGVRAPDKEIQEARFFALDALPDGLTPGTHARLAEICEGRPLADSW